MEPLCFVLGIFGIAIAANVAAGLFFMVADLIDDFRNPSN